MPPIGYQPLGRLRFAPGFRVRKKIGRPNGAQSVDRPSPSQVIIATRNRSKEERIELVYRRSSLQNSLVVADLAMGFSSRNGSANAKLCASACDRRSTLSHETCENSRWRAQYSVLSSIAPKWGPSGSSAVRGSNPDNSKVKCWVY